MVDSATYLHKVNMIQQGTVSKSQVAVTEDGVYLDSAPLINIPKQEKKQKEK